MKFVGVMLRVDMPRSRIVALMRTMKRLREMPEECSIMASINGYDDDPRPLWEIPEVQTFVATLLELGFIAYLDPFPYPPDDDGPRPFTACDLWLLPQGKLGRRVDVVVADFRKALDVANERAEAEL